MKNWNIKTFKSLEDKRRSRINCVYLLTILFSFTHIHIAQADSDDSLRSAWTPLPIQPDSGLTDSRLQRGYEVFQARCLACHGEIPDEVVPGGLPPMPGTQALQIRYKGEKPAVLESRSDLTPEIISTFVRNGIGSMPFFRPTEITDADLEALGAYLSSNR